MWEPPGESIVTREWKHERPRPISLAPGRAIEEVDAVEMLGANMTAEKPAGVVREGAPECECQSELHDAPRAIAAIWASREGTLDPAKEYPGISL